MKGKDLSKLTAEEKAEILTKLTAHKAETTKRLQTAINSYVASAEKLSTTSQALAKTTNDLKKVEQVQTLVQDVKTAIVDLKESTKELVGIQIESANLEKLIVAVEKAIAETKEAIEKAAEEMKPTEETKPAEKTKPTEVTKPAEVTAKKKTLNELLATVTVNKTGDEIQAGDKIQIGKQQYNVSLNAYEESTPGLYVYIVGSKNFVNEFNQVKQESAKTNLSLVALEDLITQLEDAIRSIENISVDPADGEIRQVILELPNTYLTDEATDEQLKEAIQKQMNDVIRNGYKVTVQNVSIYVKETGESTVEFTVEELATGRTFTSNYVMDIFSTETAQAHLKSLKEAYEKVVNFNEINRELGEGSSEVVDGVTYTVAKYPEIGSDAEKKYIDFSYAEELTSYLLLLNSSDSSNLLKVLRAVDDFYVIEDLKLNWTNQLLEELKNENEKLWNAYIEVESESTQLTEVEISKELQKLVSAGFGVIVNEIDKKMINYIEFHIRFQRV